MAAHLRLWRSQRLATVLARRPVLREAMMKHGVGIGLAESCDSLVLCKHGRKHCLEALTTLVNRSTRHHLTVLVFHLPAIQGSTPLQDGALRLHSRLPNRV